MFKALEDVFLQLFGDAAAAVNDLEQQFVFMASQAQPHLAVGGELESVVKQMAQHLFHADRIQADPVGDAGVKLGDQADRAVGGGRKVGAALRQGVGHPHG